MALQVQETSGEVQAMAEHWPIAEALLGGTASMRKASAAFLPKWPNEEPAGYESRLKTATLFPAFTRTLGVMTGKPFSKQLTLGSDTPAKIKEWADDIDQQGNNLHTFAANVMNEALGFGFCGVLVDHLKIGPDVRTVADEQIIGARPYFVFIRHAQILGWKAQRYNGGIVLTQLRLAETAEEDDGEFGTRLVERVRVHRPGSWELFEKNAKGEYTLIDGATTTLDAIPFVPFYGRKNAFMCGSSPLLDLAYLNVKHWQSQSDQDTILHVARVPILAVIGVEEGSSFSLTVGASSAVRLPVSGDMKFVEHSGAAIAAGETALASLEAQMLQTGAELLILKPGRVTATQSNNDAEASKSELQRIVEGIEDALDQALQFMADWVGEAQGGHVTLFKDFGAGSLTDASAQIIIALQQGGIITKATALREQQRRGMLSADIIPEDELAEVESEGPALGDMGADQKVENDKVTALNSALMNGSPLGPASFSSMSSAALPNAAPHSSSPPNAATDADPAPVDMQPLIDSIASLVAALEKPEAPEAPEVAAPMDFGPLIDAIDKLSARDAQTDNGPAIMAMAEAIRNMPAPVVNVAQPAITVEAAQINIAPPAITVEAPQITVAAPPAPTITMPPVNVTIERNGSVKFIEDANGKVTGAVSE